MSDIVVFTRDKKRLVCQHRYWGALLLRLVAAVRQHLGFGRLLVEDGWQLLLVLVSCLVVRRRFGQERSLWCSWVVDRGRPGLLFVEVAESG